ncbi:VOC family protein [Bordetella sp. N]|uniref:VOC family protein n=1 Tax=Bordetella sp. N TaxID=1746199 RepID=UPI00070D8C52|nr:VOC family protein [Bordetella sp. N]ALM82274.1 hypothetical protein ASB57_04230 [Bordetella sp. N]
MSLPSVTGIDHYIIRVNDLAGAAAAYGRLGFFVSPEGRHHKGTRNHTIILDANYLELLYFPPELKAGSRFASFPDHYEGPVAAALQTTDSVAVHRELAALGINAPEPQSGGRPVSFDGVAGNAAWVNTEFPADAAPLPLFFTCGHQTRELVFRPQWQDHPNTARRLGALLIAHPNPLALLPTYERLFGAISVSHGADWLEVRRGTLRLRFSTPSKLQHDYPGVLVPDALNGGWFAGSVVEVRDLSRATRLLDENGIRHQAAVDGQRVVSLGETYGTLLAFSQET